MTEAWTRRETPEWIGKSPDSVPPEHVKLRVFERWGGVCHISGRKIRGGEPWDTEHVKALRDGGENRERNLRPALRDKHREKTASENRDRAVTNRKKSKHIGLGRAKRNGFRRHPTKVRAVDGQVRERSR